MRILLFTGKGGVGKTSLAAATGVKLAELNHRTLVMSIDAAHSLGDSFDLDTDLFHVQTSDPLPINDRLSIMELNIQKEIKRHWKEISSYISAVLRTTGVTGVEAEELAILPGMEELSAMMYINQYWRERSYDAVVLDAAPTAESMRFISMPTTLDWYMKHIFPFKEWHKSQEKVLNEIEEYFAPVPVKRVPLFEHEVLGKQRLEDLAEVLYPGQQDPSAVTRTEKSYTFAKVDGGYEVQVLLPFATKGEVALFKKGDELVVEVGTLRRHIGLPRSMETLLPSRARLENQVLTIEMKETQ
jgi:anion-transporting  ArsA/GET3 family ATPase